MSKLAKQAGFGIVELVLILAVLGLVGFVGWRIYDQNISDTTESSSQSEDSDTPIDKAEDLDAEVDELNSQDIDESLDTAEIDAALQ